MAIFNVTEDGGFGGVDRTGGLEVADGPVSLSHLSSKI